METGIEARCVKCGHKLGHPPIPNKEEICEGCRDNEMQKRLDHDRKGL
jgi:DNA polymerase II large subunit